MQYDLKQVSEALFPTGFNDKLPPEYIPKGFLSKAFNCLVSEEVIEKRKGYSLAGNDVGSTRCAGSVFINTSSGLKRAYRFHPKLDGTAHEVWEWDGTGNWTLINDNLLLGATNKVNCTIAQDKIYCFDGISTPVVITPGNPTSSVDQVTDVNFPKGSFAVWFHNFLFVAGVDGYPDRLYWSNVEAPDDFTGGVTGSVDINPNDSDFITALNTLKDELLIFKENRIWSLTGFGTTEFSLTDINENISGFGAKSHRATVNTGNDVLYLSFVGGDPEIRSVNRTRYGTIVEGGLMSDDIRGSMTSLENTQLTQAEAEFDGRRAFFAVPSSGNTRNDIVFIYDTVNKGWVTWTGLYVGSWTKADFTGEMKLYFGESRDDGKFYIQDDSDSDNGAAIDFYVETRRYGGDAPERKKKWKYLYVTTDRLGSYDLTIEQSPDGFTFEPLGTVNLTPSSTTFPITFDDAPLGVTDVVRKRVDFAKRTSYYVTVRFSNRNADQPIKIRHWELLYKERALRDAKP